MQYVHLETNQLHGVVYVTAADYNGHNGCKSEPHHLPLVCGAWDSPPFRDPADKTEFKVETWPKWAAVAMCDGKLRDHSRGGTDYAQWDVDAVGGVKTAKPGDYIGYNPATEHLEVYSEAEFQNQFRRA